MGITKKNIFTEEQNELAETFKALAHPARIAILNYIVNSKSCICGDIVEEIGLAQSTISQHLKVLKNAEIIKGEIEGVSVCYCINEDRWEEIKKDFSMFFVNVENNNFCC